MRIVVYLIFTFRIKKYRREVRRDGTVMAITFFIQNMLGGRKAK